MPPTACKKTVTLNEDTTHTLTSADSGFADAADTPASAFPSVNVTALPGARTLALYTMALTPPRSTLFPYTTLFRSVFTPAPNANGTPYANFKFRVTDDGGVANGGAD